MIMIFLALFFSVATVAYGCGETPISPNLETFVVGGIDATPGSWPWQANLRSYDSQVCGGILINKQFVLTAAHCCVGQSVTTAKVGLGFYNRNGNGDAGTQRKVLKKIIIHPGYNKLDLSNDICLLQLYTPARFSDRIQPACLPNAPLTFPRDVYITGWGTTSYGGQSSETLQQAKARSIPTATCNIWLWGEVLPGMLCAGYEEGGVDTCQGDSGGPLVAKDNGKYTVYGITSWGYGCADANSPGVYADVFHFKDWIECKIAAPYASCPTEY